MLDYFLTLLAVTVFIEGLISYGNAIYADHKISWKIVVALLLSLVICFDLGLNVFNAFGLTEKWPTIGIICTAVTMSRGSNYIYTLFSIFLNLKWKLEQQSQPTEEETE